MNDLPAGYTKVQAFDHLPGWPLRFSVNQPVIWGPPVGFPLARIVRCVLCGQDVWRSARASDELPAVCRDCTTEAGLDA